MQVNSVSSNSFGQKQLSAREAVEALANASDKELKYVARQQAAVLVNDKKHRKINNLLYWSLPMAAGLAAVATNPAKAVAQAGEKVFSPLMKNAGTFVKTQAKWVGTFAFIDLLFAGRNSLSKHSETARDFDKKHPVLSTLATVGVAIGAVILGGKGLAKVAPKLSGLVKPEMQSKAVDKLLKLDKVINNNKVVKSVMNGFAKVPSSIKSVMKGAAVWSPVMLFLANISHSANHANAKREVTAERFEALKNVREKAQITLKMMDENEADEVA